MSTIAASTIKFVFEKSISGLEIPLRSPSGDSLLVLNNVINIKEALANGTVGNYVWTDLNANGLNDEAASAGINGVIVEFWSAGANTTIGGGDDVLIATKTTANSGSNRGFYSFSVSTSGSYFVKFPTVLNGRVLTTQTSTAGTNNNSDANVSTGFSPVFAINTAGSGVALTNNTIDAGYRCSVAAPVGVGAARCGTGTVGLSATGCVGGTLNWYSVASGGTALGTGTSFTSPSISTTTTYFVECNYNGCISSRVPVTATINASPAAPTVVAASRCGPGIVDLLASGCAGGTIAWYDVASGGTSINVGTSFSIGNLLATTTYYVDCTVGTCTSNRAAIIATINALPNATASNSSPVCAGSAITLNASGGVGYSWKGPNNFLSSVQNPTISNVNGLNSGNYSVTVTNAVGCTSVASTSTTITYCDANNVDCATFPSFNFTSPVLISGTAGTVGAKYRFSNVTSGTDAILTISSRSHSDIAIISLDEPSATYGGYDAAFQPIIDYNWINSGGSFDPSGEKSITFAFDFVNSGTMIAKVLPKLAMTGLDLDGSGTVNEVREFIESSAYKSYAVNTSTALTLSGARKAKGPITTYAGILESNLDAMISYYYTNVSGVSVTYGADWGGSTSGFLDNVDPRSSDERRLNSLNFKCFNLTDLDCLPVLPPTSSDVSRCGPGTVVLNASGCADGTLSWYSSAVGGTLLGTGSSFVTPSISVSTTYYVECNVLGCISSRTAVLASVQPIPPAPSGIGASICGTGTAVLTSTACTNGSINWYSSSSGGVSLASGT
ncbi:MAG: SdrD B-like domain-containing protein, partial [Saprospiraceae bacterium]